jgi:mannose-6-phosphate isomerase-like protein (cupin superfamily)
VLRETLAPTEEAAEWETHAFYVKAGESHRARSVGKRRAVLIAIMCPPQY